MLPYQPKCRLGHPENHSFLLSVNIYRIKVLKTKNNHSILKKKSPPRRCTHLSVPLQTVKLFLAEMSVGSPHKLLIFIMKKNIDRIENFCRFVLVYITFGSSFVCTFKGYSRSSTSQNLLKNLLEYDVF